jgi:hypothetical protein
MATSQNEMTCEPFFSNEIDNDNIDLQGTTATNPPTVKLKGGQQKDMSLLTQNMKPHISHNGSKCIPNNVVRCNPLPTMGVMIKVGPH